MIALVLSLTAALAADPVVDALADELERSIEELHLPDAEPPYFVAYRVFDEHRASVSAQLGGVTWTQEGPSRELGVEVRVGSPERDDSNFDTFDGGTRRRGLVVGDDPIAIRHDAWLATDRAYKGAVETLAAKEAALRRKAETDDLPDFVPGPPVQHTAAGGEPPDADALRERAVALSARFLDHPDIEYATASGAAVGGRRITLDSLGTEVIEPREQAALRVAARARADDGTTVVDHVTWVARTLDGLPSLEQMERDVDALIARLEAWRALPALDEEYIGPVLFEGDAAIDLARHLLLPPLQGTPPVEEPPRGSRVFTWDEDKGGGPMRVKRRLLPSGFDLVDDPTAHPERPSSYTHDLEGEPARAVQLVTDGVVRNHLMTRTPNSSREGSTGHGRGYPGALLRAVPANPTLTAKRTRSDRRLHRDALRVASDYDLDHYVVVRRLAEPDLSSMDGGPVLTGRRMFGFGDDEGLPAPVDVVRVYADGREEAVRSTKLVGVDTRSLRDVVAAGASRTEVRLVAPPDGYTRGLLSLPVTYTVPDLLLGEAELAPARDDAEKPPELPSPLSRQP